MYMVNGIYVFKMVGSSSLSAHFRNCQKQSKPDVTVVGFFCLWKRIYCALTRDRLK